ncbi:MAG TPA: universal stress protein, partial [Rhodothermales bacterium]|nr:universal stress protein [Rhodothermales bacterium]
MLHIKRILIPLDFSPASVAAAEYALAFGKELEAEEIHLIHILVLGPANDLYTDVLDVQDPQHHLQNLPEEWQETWHRLQHQVESAGYAFVPGMLQSDSITTPLVKYAQTHQIDLVVMATHGRTGIAHRLLGSVADGLIEY